MHSKFYDNTEKILVYASTSLSRVEVHYWNKMRESLLEKKFEFLLMGTSRNEAAENELKMPYLYVSSILSYYADVNFSYSEDAIYNIDELLKIEEKWFGVGDVESRKNGAFYLNIFFLKLIESLAPKLCLIWNGELPAQIILNNMCNRISCPVVFIERGPLPNTMQLSSLGFDGGFNGSHPVANEKKWQWPDSALQQKWQNLYFSYKKFYLNTSLTWHPQPSPNYAISIPKNKKIILFLNQLDSDTSSFYYSPYFKKNIDALKWVCSSLEGINDVFILAKQHPCNYDEPESYETIIGTQGVWTNSLSLNSCLKLADHVVGINSSALFESLVAGKAVLQLGKSLLSNKNIVYEYSPNDDSSILKWLNKVDLDSKLNNWSDFASYLFYNQLYLVDERCENYECFKNVNDMSVFLIDFSKKNKILDNLLTKEKKTDLQHAIKRHEYVNCAIKRKLRYGNGSLIKRIIYCFPYPRRIMKAIIYWIEDKYFQFI
jgi:hypothetical protein